MYTLESCVSDEYCFNEITCNQLTCTSFTCKSMLVAVWSAKNSILQPDMDPDNVNGTWRLIFGSKKCMASKKSCMVSGKRAWCRDMLNCFKWNTSYKPYRLGLHGNVFCRPAKIHSLICNRYGTTVKWGTIPQRSNNPSCIVSFE